MRMNLIEKLYYTSFSLDGEPAFIIGTLTEIFREAMNFSKVLVYKQTAEGFRTVAASPAPAPDHADLCGIKNCLSFDIKNPAGKKGELCIVTKRKGKLPARQHKITTAFAAQLCSLLESGQGAGENRQAGINEELDRYKSLLTRDNLTGLYNRYHFEESINKLERAERYPVSVIMIDVDGLKIINDTLGHRYGDEALKAAAAMLKETFRKEDIVARIGGDEFAALLPSTPRNVAEQRCRLLTEALISYNQFNNFPPLHLSIGSATSNGTGQPIRDILEEADLKMYGQKLKNRLKVGNYLLVRCLPFRPAPAERTAGGPAT